MDVTVIRAIQVLRFCQFQNAAPVSFSSISHCICKLQKLLRFGGCKQIWKDPDIRLTSMPDIQPDNQEKWYLIYKKIKKTLESINKKKHLTPFQVVFAVPYQCRWIAIMDGYSSKPNIVYLCHFQICHLINQDKKSC